MKRVPDHALGVLSRLVTEPLLAGDLSGPFVSRITDGQLERNDYLALDAVLKAVGGKWTRKVGGHVFLTDPTDKFEELMLTGQYTGQYEGDFFQTPVWLAQAMAAFLQLQAGDLVLEPSAGHGRLADPCRAAGASVLCAELFPERVETLRSAGYPVWRGDFMSDKFPDDAEFTYALGELGGWAKTFRKIIANPPFSKGQDARHLLKMIALLEPGGRLAAIAGAGVRFRQDKVYKDLRAKLDAFGAKITDLPEKTFAPDTNVNAVLIELVK